MAAREDRSRDVERIVDVEEAGCGEETSDGAESISRAGPLVLGPELASGHKRRRRRVAAAAAAALFALASAALAAGALRRRGAGGPSRVEPALESKMLLQNCHTAVKGEPCYDAVVWGMTEGVQQHPKWYPGLNANSSFDDFQLHLYAVHNKGCPLPCNATEVHLEVQISLFCFMLVLPTGYEKELLALMSEEKAGLFDCDAYEVFSDREINITSELRTKAIDADLRCNTTETGAAANAAVFMEVWKQVLRNGTYLQHDWTVKVDPDCVFFPGRLRMAMQGHKEKLEGVYMANCKSGLIAPFEVISRNAVIALDSGLEDCRRHFERQCNGPCRWSEDFFMDRCLSDVLGVDREEELGLLLADGCDPPKGWQNCKAPRTVGFHPFKDFEVYWSCLTNARGPLEFLEFK